MFSIGAVVMDSPCLSHSLRHLYQAAHSRRQFCAVLPPVAVCVRVPRARVDMASFGATVIAMGKRDYATIRSSHWPTIPIRIKHLFIHNEVKNSLNTPPQSIPALGKKKRVSDQKAERREQEWEQKTNALLLPKPIDCNLVHSWRTPKFWKIETRTSNGISKGRILRRERHCGYLALGEDSWVVCAGLR